MKRGDELTCVVDFGKFKKGSQYKITYIDNESIKVMICIDGGLYPIELVNKILKL